MDLEGLRTSVYASLIRYLEEKEYIRWRPFDASYDNGATLDDLDEDKIRSFLQVARSKRNFPLSVDTPIKELLTHLDLMMKTIGLPMLQFCFSARNLRNISYLQKLNAFSFMVMW